MANYRMLQQEADDYTKAMGSYVAAVEDYNAQAQAFNALPYVTGMSFKRGLFPGDGESASPNVTLSDGSRVFGSGLNKGDRVNVGTREVQYVDEEATANQRDSPFWRGETGPVVKTRTETYATAAQVPTLNATEPRELSFTRAEAAALQNPPQSLASAAAQTPSAIERLKEATGAKWSPYQGGLDSNKGILAKVLSGKV